MDLGRGDRILGRHRKIASCLLLVLCVFSTPHCTLSSIKYHILDCVCRGKAGTGDWSRDVQDVCKTTVSWTVVRAPRWLSP